MEWDKTYCKKWASSSHGVVKLKVTKLVYNGAANQVC